MTDIPPSEPIPEDGDNKSTINCRRCSTPLPVSARICPNCGTPVETLKAWPPPPVNNGEFSKPPSELESLSAGVGCGCLLFIAGPALWYVLGDAMTNKGFDSTTALLLLIALIVAAQYGTYILARKHRPLTARVMGFSSWLRHSLFQHIARFTYFQIKP